MDYLNLLANIFSSGAGAFAGGLAAYLWACRKDKQIKTENYLSLLLMINEQLAPLYQLFSNVSPEIVKEVDGEKMVVFDIPLPSLNLTAQQTQMLFEISPDKKMPSALIQMQNFLNSQTARLTVDGVITLPLEEIKHYAWQLKGMLLSVQVQYEQQTKNDFPLDGAIQHTFLQTKQ